MRQLLPRHPPVRSAIRRALAVAAGMLVPALLCAQGTSADWIGYNGDYRGDRYSLLTEITAANVAGLRAVCTFDTGEHLSFQTGPTVVSGVMYVTTDTATYALDAATCAQRWKSSHAYAPIQYLANNHGATFMNGRLFRMSGDVHAYALDAATGRTLWDVAIGDQKKGESAPLAPVAWNGMVYVGNAGGDNFGVTGRIYALDANDGHQLWRFDVVPDSGPAHATWQKASATNPPTGGATWTSYSLDTARGILYAPTGNPAPDFVAALHPGDNLYTTSIVALDARTGRLLGYVQPLKGDFHDWDVSPPPTLVTTRGGREMLAVASKSGLLYGVDPGGLNRWASSHATRASSNAGVAGAAGPRALLVRWSTPIATRTNTTTPLTSKSWTRFCPGSQGGAEWNGTGFHPGLNLLYVGTIDWCTSVKLQSLDTLKGAVGQGWTGNDDAMAPFGRMDPQEKWRGWVYAVDADDGTVRWRHESPEPLVAAVTPTAGGIVFTGDVMGNLLAIDARSGRVLWRSATQNSVGGGVISYAVAGKQYVAAAVGMKSPIWPVPSQSARVVVYALP